MKVNVHNCFFGSRFVGFVLFGGLNAAVTYLLYLVLSYTFHYQIAYLVAYATGIALAYVFNAFFVFKTRFSITKIVSYPIFYATQYLLGAGMMYLMLNVFGIHNALAPLLVIAMLVPCSYYMNKKALIS